MFVLIFLHILLYGCFVIQFVIQYTTSTIKLPECYDVLSVWSEDLLVCMTLSSLVLIWYWIINLWLSLIKKLGGSHEICLHTCRHSRWLILLLHIGSHKTRHTVHGHVCKIHKTYTRCDVPWRFNHHKFRNRSSQAGKLSHTLSVTHVFSSSRRSVGLLMTGSVICLLNETQKYLFTLRMFTCN